MKFTPAMNKKLNKYLDKADKRQIKKVQRGAKSIMEHDFVKLD